MESIRFNPNCPIILDLIDFLEEIKQQTIVCSLKKIHIIKTEVFKEEINKKDLTKDLKNFFLINKRNLNINSKLINVKIQFSGVIPLENSSFIDVFSSIGNLDVFLFVFELLFINEKTNCNFNKIASKNIDLISEFLKKCKEFDNFLLNNGFKLMTFLLRKVN